MNKLQRQLISGLLAGALSFTAVGAAGNTAIISEAVESTSTAESEALKAAVADVKSRIVIPAELDGFSYQNQSKYETNFFQLQWYAEDEKNGVPKYINGKRLYVAKMITVTYCEGMITGYEYYDKNFSSTVKPSFAKLTVEEQEKLAREHFNRLNPDLNGTVVFTRNTSSTAIKNATVSYSVSRTESGINVDNNRGSITINRDTGELISFSLTWFPDAGTFADASEKISVDKANSIYKDLMGLYAKYRYFENREYNSKTKEWETERFILPVYLPENSGQNEIDAITGKYTSYYDDRMKYSYTDSYTWNSLYDEYADEEEFVVGAGIEEEADNDMGFSEAELKAIDDESKYISKEKAIEIIKNDKYIVLNDKLVFQSKSISGYTDEIGEEKYKLTVSFKYTSSDGGNIYLTVNMDAYTGEIISFSKSYSDYYMNQAVNASSAEKTAQAAMEHYLGDKASEYKILHEKYDQQPTGYTGVTFIRRVNGLDADFDSVYLTVDYNGEVIGFRYTYHDMEFPEPKLVSADAAYENLFEHMIPTLTYKSFVDLQMKSHTYLTYIYDSSFIINGLDGERITYNGKPYYTEEQQEQEEITYSDIKGHKYEKEIRTLLAYGIYIEPQNGKLNPDENITIGEFYDLERNLFYISLPSFPTDGQLLAYRNKKLTNAELARIYIINYTSCKDAASLTGIYKSPFSDIAETNPYCGYIAIAKAKGIVSGTNGSFNPQSGITKGECLKLMYDYLTQDDSLDLYEIYKI